MNLINLIIQLSIKIKKKNKSSQDHKCQMTTESVLVARGYAGVQIKGKAVTSIRKLYYYTYLYLHHFTKSNQIIIQGNQKGVHDFKMKC